MGDELERFVSKNRASFDSTAPPERIWSRIDEKLRRKTSIWPRVWKVAAMLFMASTAYLLIDRSATVNNELVMPEEFRQAEAYYISQISQRREIIEQELDAEERAAFLKEIDVLDSMYVELKKTYRLNASSDRITNALINNLQLRADILDRQVEILQIIKKQKNENDLSIEM